MSPTTATRIELEDLPLPLSLSTKNERGDGQHLPTPRTEPSQTPSQPAEATPRYVSGPRANLIMGQLTVVIAMASVSTGLITTSIPRMAADLSIPPQTSFWPLSVYGLTSGACLLVAGVLADVVGSRRVFAVGNLLLSVFVLGCGLARTNVQLVMFRAMQGVAIALCLPSSVGILTRAIAPGRRRNVAFACTGLGQVLGYFAGLLFGGVFIDTVGWRVGWYALAAAAAAFFVAGLYLLPADDPAGPATLRALRAKVDWVGASIASASLALLAYALVQLSNSESSIRNPSIIAMLVISCALVPAFAAWMHIAERRNYPVLIPNSLWKQTSFVGVCLMVLLSYAVMQTMELFCTLFFQHVQGLDALQSSLRMVPAMVVATLLVLTTGLFIHKVSPIYLVLPSSFLCAGAPLLMALNNPEWPYWYAAFPAQLLQPVRIGSRAS